MEAESSRTGRWADEYTDRQTDTTNLIVVLSNFANGPQKHSPKIFGFVMTPCTCRREYELWPSYARYDRGFR